MRFLSPDSIVPLATQGTQAFDRYAYVNNNPVRYTDPSGHKVCNGADENVCETELMPDSLHAIRALLKPYGVKLENRSDSWTLRQARAAYFAVLDVAMRFTGQASDNKLAETFQTQFNTSREDPLVFGKVDGYGYQGGWYTGGAVTRNGHLILFAGIDYFNFSEIVGNIVHELGHAYARWHDIGMRGDFVTQRDQILTEPYIFNSSMSGGETFADFFVAWTYNAWKRN